MEKKHRLLDLSTQIKEADIKPLLKQFEDAGFAIDRERLIEIAKDNAASNHWKDLIQAYLDEPKEAAEAPEKVEKTTSAKRTKK